MKAITLPAIFWVLLTFLCSDSFAQDRFTDGFKAGYKEGFCYEKQSCVSPPPPPRPTLNASEKTDSYQDGYNRGFKMGLDAQNGKTSGNSQSGYKTAGADPIDYSYKPSEVQEAVAQNRYLIFDKIMEQAQEFYDQGNYAKCIKACNDVMNITKLVSKQCYTLLAKSNEKLGYKSKAKKFYKKAGKM
jgi:hypothetical protein